MKNKIEIIQMYNGWVDVIRRRADGVRMFSAYRPGSESSWRLCQVVDRLTTDGQGSLSTCPAGWEFESN